MLIMIGATCLTINALAVLATLAVRDFPAPGGKLFNVLLHSGGAYCGWLLMT